MGLLYQSDAARTPEDTIHAREEAFYVPRSSNATLRHNFCGRGGLFPSAVVNSRPEARPRSVDLNPHYAGVLRGVIGNRRDSRQRQYAYGGGASLP